MEAHVAAIDPAFLVSRPVLLRAQGAPKKQPINWASMYFAGAVLQATHLRSTIALRNQRHFPSDASLTTPDGPSRVRYAATRP
jgi:hypothetical protein